MHKSLLLKIIRFQIDKHGYLIHARSDRMFSGYRCESGIAILAWKVTWNYSYSPFKWSQLEILLTWSLFGQVTTSTSFFFTSFWLIGLFLTHTVIWWSDSGSPSYTGIVVFCFSIFKKHLINLSIYTFYVKLAEGRFTVE